MIVDEPVPVLLVVDVELRILPVIDDSAILPPAVIFGNNVSSLLSEKEIIKIDKVTR